MATRRSASATDASEYSPVVITPVGWWSPPDHVCTTTPGIMQVGQSGIVYYMPFEVGPESWTIDQIAVIVSTAGAGLTDAANFLYVGIYPANMGGSLPNLANAPIATGTLAGTAMNSAGNKPITLSATIPYGRYFMALMYRQTAVPTTYPTFQCLNTVLILPSHAAVTGNPQFRAYQITGQTTLTSVASPSFTVSTSAFIPCPYMRRSA